MHNQAFLGRVFNFNRLMFSYLACIATNSLRWSKFMSEVGTSMKALHLTVGSLVYFTYFSSAEAWGPKVSFRSFLSSPQSRKCSSLSLAQSSEVIGSGRIGAFLAEAGDCTILGRNDVIDPNQPGNPILIATRNDALEGIVDSCPKSRRGDLVFLQNGYLDDFLASKDLMNNTQVLLYLSVPTKGATPVDGVTKVNPEGLTAATGIHANAFADRVAALGMKCKTVSTADYRPAMFEKLIWICTYMLVGRAKECESVGQAGLEHSDLIDRVISELCAAVTRAEGIDFSPGTLERLSAYTDVVADFPCGVKEFEWRNQYFYKLGDDECPTHNALLRECNEKGFLAFELPSM